MVLVSLALVYYVSDMGNGKEDLIGFCQEIVNDSSGYLGHDQSWSAPDSWRYTRQFILTQARQSIDDAMSMTHKGGNLQAVIHVAQDTYVVTLIFDDIKEYRMRLTMSPNDNRGKRKPLFDPSGTSKSKPKCRLVGMLPAVARMVIAEYDHFDGLL